jgi:hypothetical protein
LRVELSSSAAIINPVSGFLLQRYSDGDVSVIRITGGGYQAKAWNPKERKWVTVFGLDWTGMGGSTDYDAVTDEEAAQALLDQGVKPDELEAVMLGLNPDESTLARVLIESARRRTSP